jgi:cobaltochelatase CobS
MTRDQLISQYPHLDPDQGNGTSSAQGARNIRRELKTAFPATKFSVVSDNYAGGNAIRINWELGPTVKQVDAITDKYSNGCFDGMTDSYNYNRSEFPRVFGGANYISTSRQFPREATDLLCAEFSKFCNVEGEGTNARFGNEWVESHVYRLLSACEFPANATITGWRRGDQSKGEEHLVPTFTTPQAAQTAPIPQPTPQPTKSKITMTIQEFKQLGFNGQRNYLRANGCKISSQMKSAEFVSIFKILQEGPITDDEPHTVTTQDGTPTTTKAEPIPAPPVELSDEITPDQYQPAAKPVQTQPNQTEKTNMNNTIETQPATQNAAIDPRAAQLAQAFSTLFTPQKAQLDENRVIELVHEHAPAPATVKIQIAQMPEIEIGRQHHKFPLLMACLLNGVHVMLTGEAGSGKTTAAENAAEVLGLDFYAQSFCATTSKADLQGYMNATGEYVETNFRRAFQQGAIFCADEFDAGNPNTNAVINQALANSTAGFPDGMTQRHQNFTVVACANTFGKGANSKYVGRNRLDAATLDRFASIRWDIDESLEASFLGIQTEPTPFNLASGGQIEAGKWLEICRSARVAADKIGAEILVSPRAVTAGARLSAAGVGKDHLMEMFIFRGADEMTRTKLDQHLVK